MIVEGRKKEDGGMEKGEWKEEKLVEGREMGRKGRKGKGKRGLMEVLKRERYKKSMKWK